MATRKTISKAAPVKKTTTVKKTMSATKKPLPKAQFGTGSGPLGLPNFEERQQRKIDRAKRKATVADIEGEGSVASKRDSRANRISKVLGTGRSKVRTMTNSNNNTNSNNTNDSYNRGSYNTDSYNRSSSNTGRPQSIIESKPSGFQSADSMTGNTSNSQMESAPKKTYGPPRILKKGGVVKKKTVAKKK
jgi:hypothetical protein